MIVNGAYRGSRAVMEELDVDNYCVTVRIAQVRESVVWCMLYTVCCLVYAHHFCSKCDYL